MRITKKGDALVHRAPRTAPAPAAAGHDRVKQRLFDVGAPRRPGVPRRGRRRRRAGADQAEQAGQVPPGGGVRPAARVVARRRARGWRAGRAVDREPLARGRSRLRPRLPHGRCLRLAGPREGAPGARSRGRRARAVPRSQRRPGAGARLGRRAHVRGRDDRRRCRGSRARRRHRPARVRHGHRRRARPRSAVGLVGRARRALLPPRPAGAGLGVAGARAVHARRALRPAARAVPRRPHRHAPRVAAAPGRLPGRRRRVRERRAHQPQPDAARSAHGSAVVARGRRRLRPARREWGVAPALATRIAPELERARA